VTLEEGSVKESTLFRALSRGGLGDAGPVLARLVPEVGRGIESLARHLAFSRLHSRFRVGGRRVTIEEGRLESAETLIGFRGWADFESRTDLAVRVVVGGRTGERLASVLPSRTIPLRVTGTLDEPRTLPSLSVKDLVGAGLLDRLPIPGLR
jgi:hypothetical protein